MWKAIIVLYLILSLKHYFIKIYYIHDIFQQKILMIKMKSKRFLIICINNDLKLTNEYYTNAFKIIEHNWNNDKYNYNYNKE